MPLAPSVDRAGVVVGFIQGLFRGAVVESPDLSRVPGPLAGEPATFGGFSL